MCDAANKAHTLFLPDYSTGMCNMEVSLKFRAEFQGVVCLPASVVDGEGLWTDCPADSPSVQQRRKSGKRYL